jgi:hypothetical protein
MEIRGKWRMSRGFPRDYNTSVELFIETNVNGTSTSPDHRPANACGADVQAVRLRLNVLTVCSEYLFRENDRNLQRVRAIEKVWVGADR